MASASASEEMSAQAKEMKISDPNLSVGDFWPRVIFNLGEHPNEIKIACKIDNSLENTLSQSRLFCVHFWRPWRPPINQKVAPFFPRISWKYHLPKEIVLSSGTYGQIPGSAIPFLSPILQFYYRPKFPTKIHNCQNIDCFIWHFNRRQITTWTCKSLSLCHSLLFPAPNHFLAHILLFNTRFGHCRILWTDSFLVQILLSTLW